MMHRRPWLLLPALLAGCGLAERPYEERRTWPLTVPRPTALPPRRGGRVLEVRSFRAGPAMSSRGLQVLQPDGSVRIAFYEEWAVPPAQGVEDALRAWLAVSGRFAAVTAPGSRAVPDLVLEGDVEALVAVPSRGEARAALGIVLVDVRRATPAIQLQRRLATRAPLAGDDPEAMARAEIAALAALFGEVEAAVG